MMHLLSKIVLVAAGAFSAGTAYNQPENYGLAHFPATRNTALTATSLAIPAAALTAQHFFDKHHERRADIVNFAGAGAFTGLAIHNLIVRDQPIIVNPPGPVRVPLGIH